jgi:hypothetical protein
MNENTARRPSKNILLYYDYIGVDNSSSGGEVVTKDVSICNSTTKMRTF